MGTLRGAHREVNPHNMERTDSRYCISVSAFPSKSRGINSITRSVLSGG